MNSPLWLLLDSEMEGGGMLNQMHHIVVNTVFENILEPILWSQWETGLCPLSLKVHAGKDDGSSSV